MNRRLGGDRDLAVVSFSHDVEKEKVNTVNWDVVDGFDGSVEMK